MLLRRIEPIGNLLGDQGGIAAGTVFDDEIDLDLVLSVHFITRNLTFILPFLSYSDIFCFYKAQIAWGFTCQTKILVK